MFEGTPLTGLKEAQQAAQEDIFATLKVNPDQGKVLTVLKEDGSVLDTPGVAVVEVAVERYDKRFDQVYPALEYWVVAGEDVFTLSDIQAGNLRVGQVQKVLDISPLEEPTCEVRFNASIEPVEKLLSYGGFNNPQEVYADLVLESTFISEF